MQDLINFKGHFKIQSVDDTGIIVDEWQDDNLIMESARSTMSKIFTNLNTAPKPFINKFRLGTLGHNHGTNPHDISTGTLTPKTDVEGFAKERNRLFSEFNTITSGVTTIAVLNKGDVVYNDTLDNSVAVGYYQYNGATTASYPTTAEVLAGADWDFIDAAVEPYKVEVDFTLPGTTVVGGSASTINSEDDTLSTGATGSEIKVEQNGTSVIFYIIIPQTMGNAQFGTSSKFTEAALYADDEAIFSMKTFNAKIKDSTVELRVTWTITF